MFRICAGVKPRRCKPDRIDAVRLGRPAHRHDIGRHIAGHGGVVRDETVRAHLGVLVHRRQAAHGHPIADLHVTAQRRAIRHHDLIAQLTIVRDMRIRHQQIVVADARHALVVGGAAIHGDGFAKHIAVADLEARRLAVVFLVLRRIAQRGELEYLVVGADARRAVDHRMRAYPGAGADDDIRADDGRTARFQRPPRSALAAISPPANRSSRRSRTCRRLGLGRHHDFRRRHFLAVDLRQAVELPNALE